MPSLSISTWSLHRQLGRAWYVPSENGLENRNQGTDGVPLMEIPKMVARHGIHQLEVCHFHFPSIADDYLEAFRDQLSEHGVAFYTLLIDTGDITHPDPVQRENELELIKKWIDVAGVCGARYARVVAGEAEANSETIALSAQNLGMLADYAEKKGVLVATENFKKLTQRADTVQEILDRCEKNVGLCTDFGNFKGQDKYSDLAAVMPRATTIHAKGNYVGGQLDRVDFKKCMQTVMENKFDGPCVLIFSDDGEEWPYLESLKEEVLTYF